MSANAQAANALMAANTQTIFAAMASNALAANAVLGANTAQMHSDLQANMDALNDYIALKSNIINPTFEDLVTVSGNLVVTNNLTVLVEFTQVSTINTIVNDALIEVGNNNNSTDLDLGIIMTRSGSNVEPPIHTCIPYTYTKKLVLVYTYTCMSANPDSDEIF